MRNARRGAGLWAALLILSGCASSEYAAVNQEAGFYYGYGTGKTEAASDEAAFADLVYTTFTVSGGVKKDTRARTVLSAEMKAAVAPLAPKPYLSEKKAETSFSTVFRIKYADWAKAEASRLAGLQADLGVRADRLFSDPKPTSAERLAGVQQLLQELDRQGARLSLRTGGDGSPLVGDTLVQNGRNLLAGARLKLSPDSGAIRAGDQVTAVLTNGAGQPLSGLNLQMQWVSDTEAPAAQTLTTDSAGLVTVTYPVTASFRNTRATLKAVSKVPGVTPDATAQAAYRNTVILANLKTDEVRIEGGAYTVGAVKQDRRAGSKEKARTASVKTFYMEKVPVTNAQYRSYLVTNEIPADQWPDFLEGELGGDDQPVVGVTLAEAQKYAEWVSSVTGTAKRLPTEAEYEAAARGLSETIYPWGDQPPTDGVRANYSGNKKFASTSPVGSFPNGATPNGLLDLVGNVWVWTTSDPDGGMTAEPGTKVIKGGSWLDGPGELRISNRRAVDPAESASDLGFRLVREDK